MPIDIANIDPRFIDVVFPDQPEFTFGCQPEPAYSGLMRAFYEDVVPVMSEDELRRVATEMQASGGGLSRYITRICNQRNEGSCVGNMEAQMMQVLQAIQFGKENVTQLSQTAAYKLIGSSPNSGASISDALDMGTDIGILPLDTPTNRAKFGNFVMPENGFRSPWPAGDWKAVAANFRFTERFVIRSVAGLLTALCNEHPVGVGRSGHSILYLDPIFKDGKWYVLYVNSWGEWGTGAGDFTFGFGLDSANLIRSSASWCFAARAVTVPPWALAI